MNILVVGYPYARPNNRATLAGDSTFFLVPSHWTIKKGKSVYHTNSDDRIFTTRAFFHHSDYPVIGGLLKGWMPLFPWYVWRLKRKHDIRLVFDAHEPNLLTTLYNGFFSKLLGLKHIVFSWQNVSLLLMPLIKINLWFSDGVVCGNQKCLELFKKITKKPMAAMPLAGLDPEKFRPLPRENHREVTFLFAGAIDYRKGLHVLLPAFEKFKKIIPDANLILVGSGTYEKQIDYKIIPWTDHVELVKIFSQSDIFVYPSISYNGWEEQFGYSMAEASLMELPVISTKTGSIDEIVVDGKTGILVPEKDETALFDAMKELAIDPERRIAMGRAGRAYIIQKYSNAVISKKFNDFFKTF